MMATQDEKVHENRVRRMAQRQGLTLIKSRSRDRLAPDFGTYGLVRGQRLVAGHAPTGQGLSLDDVVQTLVDRREVRVLGSDYEGDPGDVTFGTDKTPILDWLGKGRWVLHYLDDSGETQDYALAGGREDKEFALALARQHLAELERDQERDDPTPEVDPIRAFHTGKAFYHAGRRCLGQVEIVPGTYESLEWPGAVNFCLAAEVFMKALYYLRVGARPKTHKLDVLFNKLAPEDKAGIAALYVDKPLHPKIEEDIEEIKDYFEDLRYYHESDRLGYWHDPAARFADRLYRYVASVLEGAETHGDPYP